MHQVVLSTYKHHLRNKFGDLLVLDLVYPKYIMIKKKIIIQDFICLLIWIPYHEI